MNTHPPELQVTFSNPAIRKTTATTTAKPKISHITPSDKAAGKEPDMTSHATSAEKALMPRFVRRLPDKYDCARPF